MGKLSSDRRSHAIVQTWSKQEWSMYIHAWIKHQSKGEETFPQDAWRTPNKGEK